MARQSNPELDEIEQQIVLVVTSILQEGAMRVDERSYVARMIGRASGKAAAERDDLNEELWKKTLIARLCALGRRLGFTSSEASRGWMFDVMWRAINDAGDWHTTSRVSLVLYCDFNLPSSELLPFHPSFEYLDKLMVARAEHRALICQHPYGEGIFDRSISYLKQCEFTKKGDRYLFLSYNPVSKEFASRVFVA